MVHMKGMPGPWSWSSAEHVISGDYGAYGTFQPAKYRFLLQIASTTFPAGCSEEGGVHQAGARVFRLSAHGQRHWSPEHSLTVQTTS